MNGDEEKDPHGVIAEVLKQTERGPEGLAAGLVDPNGQMSIRRAMIAAAVEERKKKKGLMPASRGKGGNGRSPVANVTSEQPRRPAAQPPAEEESSVNSDLLNQLGVSSAKNPEVIQLPIRDIHPLPGQPRQFFDPAGLASLAKSMKVSGQLQPVLVVKSDVKNQNRREVQQYELVDGERRWRAAQMVDLRTLSAIVVSARDADHQWVTSFLSNEHRETLTEMEEAFAFGHIIRQLRIVSGEELAKLLGKSYSFIVQRLILLKLAPGLQQYVGKNVPKERRISTVIAMQLARTPSFDLQEKWWEHIQKCHLGVLSATAYVTRQMKGQSATGRCRKPSDDMSILKTLARLTCIRATMMLELSDDAFSRMFESISLENRAQVINDLAEAFNQLSQVLDRSKAACRKAGRSVSSVEEG